MALGTMFPAPQCCDTTSKHPGSLHPRRSFVHLPTSLDPKSFHKSPVRLFGLIGRGLRLVGLGAACSRPDLPARPVPSQIEQALHRLAADLQLLVLPLQA